MLPKIRKKTVRYGNTQLYAFRWLLTGTKGTIQLSRFPAFFRSEEFELTANSLGAYIETHGKSILRTLSYLTVNSQDDSHCELAVR